MNKALFLSFSLFFLGCMSLAMERDTSESLVYSAILDRLLQANSTVDLEDQDGRTALHRAAKKGQLESVQSLLQAGALVNRRTSKFFSRTPLFFAAENGHPEVVKFLLANGADVTQVSYRLDKHGSPCRSVFITGTPLHVVADDENYSANKPLEENSHMKVLKVFLDAKIDVNVRDSVGGTPLHWAIGCLAVVELLLHAGADPHIKSRSGVSPLHQAVDKCNLQVVNLLLQAGVSVNVQDNDGATPLHWLAFRLNQFMKKPDWTVSKEYRAALQVRTCELAKQLLKAGADTTIKDKTGATPLDLAGDHAQLIKDLLVE